MKLLILFFGVVLLSGFNSKKDINKFIKDDISYLKDLYIDIHKNPEISLMEKETSKKLANELNKIGFDVTENFGGYGIVSVDELEGASSASASPCSC